ncbi:MAG TPA: phenylalanine--tRNA ligase subunit beta [Burkholderiales bacterium]|nr:phenylalanine--tRNA ligase subunit beta [Burkholderiales bacterium]
MRFSESWLRTLVDPPLSTEQLTHLLTMSGLEVEECESVAPPFSGVVVAEVKEVAKHPDADKLSLCRVDVGVGSLLNIVCGAPNVAPGMKVPCATVGAILPGDGPDKPFQIKLAKVRGVESQGMLCSASELGLPQEQGGLLVLPLEAPIGVDFRRYADLDDALITIKLTPNRADCLSVLGVAREVAALTQAPLKAIDTTSVVSTVRDTVPVKISDSQACGRFTSRIIRNVNAKAATPRWMKDRLERAGQRSISALVDVSNYVMLEMGRPLHVYDLDKLKGGIDVRFGRKGETLKLLNEQVVEVFENVLAITDVGGAIGLAGVMGGDSTKADLDTCNIFVESAFFFPDVIAGRARRYNFTSDASHRFERGVDFDNTVSGIERATQLILEICGGAPGPVVDQVAQLPERKPVTMRVARAQKVIGVEISVEQMAAIFQRLALPFVQDKNLNGEDVFVVTPPSYRFDLEIEEDLIEEVVRVYGYENIPVMPPVAPAVMRVPPENRRSLFDLRERLVACDYQETINFSFVEEAWERDFAGNENMIRLKNPIASQMSVMRSTLIGSLVENLRFNLNRKASRVRVFEVGRTFLRAPDQPRGDLAVAGYRQPMRIAALAYGSSTEEQWGEPTRPVDFFDVKADLEALVAPRVVRFIPAPHPALHPGRSARIDLAGEPIGWIGELHPRWQQKYELPMVPILFEVDADTLRTWDIPRYEEVSKFPPVRRDLAIVVDESITVDQIFRSLEGCLPKMVTDVSLFDVYSGKGIENGKKSLAFRVLMQDTEKTLKDQEVDGAMQQIMQIIASGTDAKLRS